MEYNDLLEIASAQTDPQMRLLYVTAFCVGRYASTHNRLEKPFNPILGETFELVDPQGRYKCISEQVSHHPPVSCIWTESPNYKVWMSSNFKSKMTPKYMEVKATTYMHVVLT
jgi:hypothetical protein